MALHCTKANHIYHRHAYDKNTVRKDVNYRQFIAYCYWWDVGLPCWCQIEIDKKRKSQLVNSDRVRTNMQRKTYPCSEHWTSSKPSCFENLQSQIQVCLYVTSEILCVGGKLICSDRTNSRKAYRGGSVSTRINRRKFDFVRRSFTSFRDISKM